MSYKVTLFNQYASGETDTVEFDTESALLHDAMTDAEIEMFTKRMNNGANYTERPVKQVFTAIPTLDLRRG